MIKCVSETCDYYNAHKDCSAICEKQGFKKILSNADRIRSMSDEELAAFLEGLVLVALGDYSLRDTQRRLNWLRQPAETEGTE